VLGGWTGARDEEQVTRLDRSDVVGGWLDWLRERDIQLLEALLNAHSR
jgi:hypothetical protein